MYVKYLLGFFDIFNNYSSVIMGKTICKVKIWNYLPIYLVLLCAEWPFVQMI